MQPSLEMPGHPLELPPLRLRREDLGLLISALLARLAPGVCAAGGPPAARARALLRYGWPGNVRELEKCLGAAAVLAQGGSIAFEHLSEAVQGATDPAVQGLEDTARREQLIGLLREHRGSVAAVARAMGRARMQVQRWLKRYEIDPASFRR